MWPICLHNCYWNHTTRLSRNQQMGASSMLDLADEFMTPTSERSGLSCHQCYLSEKTRRLKMISVLYGLCDD